MAGLVAWLAAGPAAANDMAGLAFVVIIWPVGLLCSAALLVLAIIGTVKRRRGHPNVGFADGLQTTALIIAVVYPIVCVLVGGGAGAPISAWVITIAPVVVLAVVCLAVGRSIRAQAVAAAVTEA